MGKHPVEHIVCLLDLSRDNPTPFHHALALALATHAQLTLLHIGPQHQDEVDWGAFPRVRDTLADWGRLTQDADKADVAAKLGVEVRKQAFRDSSLLQGLKAYLRQHHTDLVVSASTAGGRRWFREPGIEGLVRANLTHLLLLPEGSGFVSPSDGRLQLEHAIMPVADNPHPSTAVRLCEQLLPALSASKPQAALLHVGNRSSAPELALDEGSIDWQWTFGQGRVIDQIHSNADARKANLIIMPSAGRPGIWQALRRSYTEQVLYQSNRAVLAVASA